MSDYRRTSKAVGRGVAIIFAWLVVSQGMFRLFKRFVHFPAPPPVTLFFNSRLRRKMQSPEQVVDWMALEAGWQVVEIGPGGGVFTAEAARQVGPDGRVYAFDIQPGMIARLQSQLAQAALTNVTAEVASAYDLPLSDASIDRAFMITVLPEIPDKQAALAEIRRVLKPDGILAIGELIVDPDYPLRRTVVRWCRDAGLDLIATYNARMHYLLLFKPRKLLLTDRQSA